MRKSVLQFLTFIFVYQQAGIKLRASLWAKIGIGLLLVGALGFEPLLAQQDRPICLDLVLGPNGSLPSELAAFPVSPSVRPRLFMGASIGNIGIEPYVVDGNIATLLRNINTVSAASGSNPYNFIEFNNSAYFFANRGSTSGNTGGILFRNTQGNPFTHSEVAVIFPNNDSQGNFLVDGVDSLFFAATNTANNVELWRSDGAQNSTATVQTEEINLNPGRGSFPEDLTVFNIGGIDYIFFSADNSAGATAGTASPDRELFVKDITNDRGSRRFDINPTGASNPHSFTLFNGWCYFIANNGSNDVLYRSNGITFELAPGFPIGVEVDPNVDLEIAGSTLYLSARNSGFFRVWRHDGFTVTQVPGSPNDPDQFTELDGFVYFAGQTPLRGRELWRTNGLVSEIIETILSPQSANPSFITAARGFIYYFVTQDATPTRSQLWSFDPTKPPFLGELVPDIFFTFDSGADAATIGPMLLVGNDLYFVARGTGPRPDGFVTNGGLELWRAEECPFLVIDYKPGTSDNILCSSSAAPAIPFDENGNPLICNTSNCFAASPAAGIVIDPNTGEIDLAASQEGVYTITYTFKNPGGGCNNTTATQEIEIRADAEARRTVETISGVLGNRGSNDGPVATATFDFNELRSTIPNPAGQVPNISGAGLALSPTGDTIYVADEFNHAIRLIDLSNGQVSTLAGNPAAAPGFADGIGSAARFNQPSGVDTDQAGFVYVADKENHIIRRINPTTGQVITVAGIPNTEEDSLGFDQPADIALDPNGNIYVADKNNHRIKVVTPSGLILGVTGGLEPATNNFGFQDGPVANAQFRYPTGIDIDAAGNIYVADQFNNRIRVIDPSQTTVSTFAGSGPGGSLSASFQDGPSASALFRFPSGVSVGSNGDIYVPDRGNERVRLISGGQVTTYAGSTTGFADGPAINSLFDLPRGVVAGNDGSVYIVDGNNQLIRRVFDNNPVGEITGAGEVCPNNNSGTLVLRDYNGPLSDIQGWEQAIGGGAFTPIAGTAGDTTYTFNNIPQSTIFRVAINDAFCGTLFSNETIVETSAPAEPTIISTPQVCSNPMGTVTIDLIVGGAQDGEFRWYVDNNPATLPLTQMEDTLQITTASDTTLYVSIEINGCETNRVAVPVQLINTPLPVITPTTDACEGETLTYQVTTPDANNAYDWNVTGGTIVSSGTNIASGLGLTSIQVNWGTSGVGQVQLTESTVSPIICMGDTAISITINPRPNPSVIAGSDSACIGQTLNYSVAPELGFTFDWTVTGGTFTSNGTSTISGVGPFDINWNTTGLQTISVLKTDNGTSCDTTSFLSVTVNANPNPIIDGPSLVCFGDTATYQITAVGEVSGTVQGGVVLSGGTTFNFTGTNNVQIIWDGIAPHNLSVTETNAATGCFTMVDFPVTVDQVPSPDVNGDTVVCLNQVTNYQVDAPIAGRRYTWIVTGGIITLNNSNTVSGVDLTQVDIQWNTVGIGTLQLQEIIEGLNGCAGINNVNVAVNPFPEAIITGDPLACQGDTLTYTVQTPDPLNTYTWAVPSGGVIIPGNVTTVSGVGQTQIQVVWQNVDSVAIFLEEVNPAMCTIEAQPFGVRIIAIPNTDITGDITVCAGDTITYSAAAPPAGIQYTYNWLVEGGEVVSGQGQQQAQIRWFPIPPSGTEHVRVQIQVVGANCQATTPIPGGLGDPGFITINPLPEPEITSTDGLVDVCAGAMNIYTTVAPLDAGHTYDWSVSGGTFTTINPNEIQVTWGSPGTGTISLSETITATGCTRAAQDVTVTINTSPEAPMSNNRFVCNPSPSEDLTLTAEEPTGVNYRWYTTATGGTPVFEGNPYLVDISTPTTFFVSAVNAGGCEGPRQQVDIAVDPVDSEVEFATNLVNADSCINMPGDSPSGRIDLELTANNDNGPYAFLWTKDEDPSFNATSQNLSALTQGNYRVIITDDGNCQTLAGPFLIEEQLKQITDATIISDTVIAEGEPIILSASATDAENFLWTDSTGTVIFEGADSTFTLVPEQSTTYTVTITNDRNCDTTLSVRVEVIPLVLYIPNTFSPNNEGVAENERFRIYGTGIQEVELRVFNRLGELLFSTNEWIEGTEQDDAIGWDGTFKGIPQANGNYVWSLTGRYINNATFKRTGNVLLIR